MYRHPNIDNDLQSGTPINPGVSTGRAEMKIELAETYRNTDQGREAEALLLPCVQCGQCTFTCPTFRLLDDEWDGPRGRIYLIKQMLEGKAPSAPSCPRPIPWTPSKAGRSAPTCSCIWIAAWAADPAKPAAHKACATDACSISGANWPRRKHPAP